jgi:hypothetical protein
MYIILVGPPAHARKTACLNVAMDLLTPLEEEALLHTSSESITMAKLYDDLHAVSDTIEVRGKPYTYMAMIALATELGSFIKSNEHLLVGLLIELYDCKKKQDHSTRSKGTVPLKNVCLNILAATTPRFFEGLNFEDRVRTGFTSRCIFIYAQTRRFNKSNGIFSEKLREELIKDLIRLNREVWGYIPLSPDAQILFDEWYDNQSLIPDVAPAILPYYGRKQTYVRKMSMIYTAMAMLDGHSQETSVHHVEQAIQDLEEVEPYIIQAYKGAGRSANLRNVEDIIATLQLAKLNNSGPDTSGWIAKAEIIKRHWKDIDAIDIVAILNSLCVDQKIIERMRKWGDYQYRWKGEVGG